MWSRISHNCHSNRREESACLLAAHPLHEEKQIRGFAATEGQRSRGELRARPPPATIMETRVSDRSGLCGYPGFGGEGKFHGQECPSHIFPRVPVEMRAPPALVESALERKRPAG